MSLALLADENFPGDVIKALLAAGYDVLSVATYSPGINDRAVLELACSTGRRLLTFDSDFGDLIFAQEATAPVAILYFRLHPIVVEEVTQIALRALGGRSRWLLRGGQQGRHPYQGFYCYTPLTCQLAA